MAACPSAGSGKMEEGGRDLSSGSRVIWCQVGPRLRPQLCFVRPQKIFPAPSILHNNICGLLYKYTKYSLTLVLGMVTMLNLPTSLPLLLSELDKLDGKRKYIISSDFFSPLILSLLWVPSCQSSWCHLSNSLAAQSFLL